MQHESTQFYPLSVSPSYPHISPSIAATLVGMSSFIPHPKPFLTRTALIASGLDSVLLLSQLKPCLTLFRLPNIILCQTHPLGLVLHTYLLPSAADFTCYGFCPQSLTHSSAASLDLTQSSSLSPSVIPQQNLSFPPFSNWFRPHLCYTLLAPWPIPTRHWPSLF